MATTASIPAYLLPGVTVVQPPHLEGDASLATEILPGPPSAASVQQMALKRDPKKPSMSYSYLPSSDPGSTYSGIMHGTLIGQDPEAARSKRARDKGTATGRAQRASARQQATTSTAPTSDTAPGLVPTAVSAPQLFPVGQDPNGMVVDDELALSRTSSSTNPTPQDPTLPIAGVKAKRKDKGKEKEADTPPLRVKEEAKTSSLQTPEPSNLLNNEDHCSSCRSSGALVYCDGCPKAFHLWCLDPPQEGVDDARWFCPTCVARKHPPRKPPPSLLAPAIHQLQTSHPIEFQLPEEIRTFFKDVSSGPRGSYVDTSQIKPPRLNRHGQLEDRDPHRLRDRNGGPVLCYSCGQSSLPQTLSTSAPAAKRPRRSTSKAASPPDAWKSMVSCDYCTLHWHLDCLNPPLSTLPPFNKKWMCPNHAERVLPLKRRIPKLHANPIEITKPRQFNNGNIDVIHPQYLSAVPGSSMNVDEVLINGRRYRVPEKIIVLDFWNRLNKWDEHLHRDDEATSTGMSSPLTELSSLDDEDDQTQSHSEPMDLDDFSAAQLLVGISAARTEPRLLALRGPSKRLVDRGIQTESDAAVTSGPTKPKVMRSRKHAAEPSINGLMSLGGGNTSSVPAPTSVTISTVRRKRQPRPVVQTEPVTRQLRSRSRNTNADTPLTSVSSRSSLQNEMDSSKESLPPPSSLTTPITQHQPRAVHVKMEELEAQLTGPMVTEDTADPFRATVTAKARVIRPPRPPATWSKPAPLTPAKDSKERRGKKRKIREDDVPGNNGENNAGVKDLQEHLNGKDEKHEKESRKIMKTPTRVGQLSITHPETSPAAATSVSILQSPSTTTITGTPSLKIRLPRLSNFSTGTSSGLNLESPTKR
ncbi:hypothetical protein CPB83DRAFT_891105 [Crepidotus variabilis]|uniref:PHD-type domain-containing protein n=1 Tax=Crepidotus variabilis TaxID=179855 RepID=A0A9P6ENQ8_9AGAR|nr:hypothetical protein CPB83DRAFT_891105 [Crepidotus variabilis]